jgi:hypothetical protein
MERLIHRPVPIQRQPKLAISADLCSPMSATRQYRAYAMLDWAARKRRMRCLLSGRALGPCSLRPSLSSPRPIGSTSPARRPRCAVSSKRLMRTTLSEFDAGCETDTQVALMDVRFQGKADFAIRSLMTQTRHWCRITRTRVLSATRLPQEIRPQRRAISLAPLERVFPAARIL